MQNSFKTFACIIIIILGSSLKIHSQNLLNNGDFESGFGVGFFSNGAGYTRIVGPFSGTTSPGNYAITTNPQPMNTANFISSGDHTNGFGNMMIIDGNTTGGQQNFWEAGNGGGGVCSLTVGTTYTFSFWLKSVSTTVTNAATQAALGVQILNASAVTLVSGSLIAPLPAAGWQKVTYTFVAQSTCCNIKLYNNNTNAVGNDFAVDDFSVTPPLVPLSINHSFTNPTCPGATDGSISAYGVGGTVPYASYSLTGTAIQTNSTGIFTNLAAGTYSVSVTDAASATATQTNIVLTAPIDLTVSAGSTICPGTSVTLNVSGSSAGYTWTASPLDATLTAPTTSNPTVSPTQTTTYTVTSSTSTPTSLISNGNFTSGNTGFTTDYQYLVTTVPAGAQKTYGIVTSSNGWFAGFSNCVDHTSGSGNMMVVDGSTSNAGNDRVWCQTVPVVAGQNYTFSYWIESLSGSNFGNMEVLVNGVSIGSSVAPATTCSWVQKSYTWNSGASITAQICIYDRTITAAGNDFAIDDISFTGPVSCTLQKTVTITVNPKPVITASVTAQPTCTVSTGTITVSAPIGATYEYSINGGAYQSSPTFSGLAANSYTVVVRNTATTCVSNAVNLTVNPASGTLPNVSGTTGPGPNCTVKLIGNSTNLGVTITWNGPSLPLNSANPATATVSGTYTVTVFDPVSGCSNSTTVNAVIPTVPAAPVATTVQPTCSLSTGSINITSPVGANLEYSINSTTFQTGTSFTGLVPATYNVTVRNITSSCISPATSITISPSASSAAPTATSPVYLCQGQAAPSLTATASAGGTLLWYGTNATGGVGSPIATIPSTTTTGTTTYYVSQTDGTCESPRKAINVIVNNLTGTITMFCDPSQVTTSPVSSVYFDWNNLPGPPVYNYTYSINGGPLVSGSTNLSHYEVLGVLPGQSVTLTIVSANGYPCVAPISHTCNNCNVSTTPTFTIPSSFCSGSVAPILPTTSIEGITGTWAPAVVSNTASGSYVFTPNATLFPCANGPVTKGITVTPLPTAGTLGGNQNVCVGSTTTFTSTTSGGSWTSSNTAIATVVAATGVVTGVLGGTATMTYTVTGTGGCSNVTATRTVTVTAAPSAGTLSGNQAICVGQTSVFSSTISGGAWTSSNTAIATVNAASGIITGVAAGTATISYTAIGTGGCANAVVTRTVTINAIPSAGTLSGNQNICIGLTTTFSSTATGGTYSSANTAVATVNATTGLITGVAAGTAIITYTVAGTGGCTNGTVTRTVIVSSPPVAGILSGNQNICVSTTTTFSSTITGGTWSSSNIAIATVNATTGVITGISAGTATITYTVSGTGGCANVAVNRTVTITAVPNPGTLSGNQTICIGFSTTFAATTAGGLWTTSNSGIASVNAAGVIIGVAAGTATITYTVPGTGGCTNASATRTVTVSATPNPGVLSGNQNLCVGQTSTFVSTVTGGAWSSSNTTVATINAATGLITALTAGTAIMTYTVTGAGGCANTSSTRTTTVTANITPTFNPIAPICSGSVLAPLPLTSTNGITGTWAPALNNTTTTPYTFTPTAGQCATTTTLTITVNPKIVPLFGLFAPVCQGAAAPVLPTSSENVPPITGTWSPAVSTATVGTRVYTFTPTAGQCVSALPTTLAITVVPVLVPNFAAIPPFCNGKTPVPTLSNTSPNGVEGTWSPAVISNTVSRTYLFTPNADQCATTKTLTVTIIPKTIPDFPIIPPFCKGSTAPLLATTSPNGITGTWSPLTIDNTTSGTFAYTFTPNATECATTQTLNVTVTEPVLPNFPDITLCTGTTPPLLTGTSPNGITGTWLPTAVDNTTSSSYVFTPNTGECAIPQTINVTINQYTLVAIDGVVTNYFEDNQIITVLASDPGNYSYQLDDGLFQDSNVFENVSSGIHTIKVIDVNGCSAPLSDQVLVINYPKFFTPNEDTYNDKWNIFGLKDQENSVIFIYDRYGKLLKEISPNGDGWDGTYNGRPMPSSDYWFTVDYLENNVTKQFKAHFSLKR